MHVLRWSVGVGACTYTSSVALKCHGQAVSRGAAQVGVLKAPAKGPRKSQLHPSAQLFCFLGLMETLHCTCACADVRLPAGWSEVGGLVLAPAEDPVLLQVRARVHVSPFLCACGTCRGSCACCSRCTSAWAALHGSKHHFVHMCLVWAHCCIMMLHHVRRPCVITIAPHWCTTAPHWARVAAWASCIIPPRS